MINKTIKVIFTDATETLIPGVYSYSYTAVDDVTFSRGNWRNTFPYNKIADISTFVTEDDGATAISGKYRVPDEVMGIAPRTKYEAVILLQFLDSDDAIIGQFLTNDVRAWHVS